MESTRYVRIPCRTCGSQMFVIVERPLPKRCTRCGAAFDPERRAFDVRQRAARDRPDLKAQSSASPSIE